MRPTTLGDLLDSEPARWDGELAYPEEALAAELTVGQLSTLRKFARSTTAYREIFVEPDQAAAGGQAAVARAASVAWRKQERLRSPFLEAQQDALDAVLEDGLRITTNPKVSTVAREGVVFPITIENGLPVDESDPDVNAVRLRLVFVSENRQRLTIKPIEAPLIRAGESDTAIAQVTAKANGTVPVRAQLQTLSGTPVGRPKVIDVRVTQNGTTGWAIAAAALVLFGGGTALRIRTVSRTRGGAAGARRCGRCGRRHENGHDRGGCGRARGPRQRVDLGATAQRAGHQPPQPTPAGRTPLMPDRPVPHPVDVVEADATTVQAPVPGGPAPTAGRTASLISASALMAAGTLLSRVLGFGRLMLLVFLFGNATRQADMFTIANTVPNSMYILLAGGVLNTVLVPQIVRAIKGDPDGGEAYTNRIMTAGLLALAVITAVLTLAAPLVIWLYSSSEWRAPGVADQYASMVTLAYYCMPQVFFYGVHVLAGQVLNARDRFGPMMWAPIANNVVSILVLGLFLVVFGRGGTAGAFSTGEELLLGLGSTLGIAVQAAVLVPFLRAAGYHFRPRWDFRGVGLGKTLRLARWTLGFVLVTQLALVVVSKLATRATAGGAGAGLTAYYNAYALWILPHSLVTVSLATAMLPAASRMAASADLDGVAAETTRAIRLALTALLPAAVAFLTLGVPLAQLLFGFGQGARDASYVGWALMALALGLVPFTVQYLCLRAYYALEDTRTPFLLQILISGANVVLGVAVVALVDTPSLVAAALGLAYALAYALGVGVSLSRLRRRLPTLDTFALVEHCVRLLVAVTPAAVAAVALVWWLDRGVESQVGRGLVLALAGLVAVAAFLVAARLLRIAEVDAVLATLLRRGRTEQPLPPPPTRTAALGRAPAAGAGATHDLATTGDSETLIRPVSPTIEPPPTAGPASQPPAGSTENADSMAQAAVVRTHPEDEADLGDASTLPAPTEHGPAGATATKAATLPAGTVLASRYRLAELLAVSGPAITWRAFDQVLSRSVLVHLLPPGDEAEADLMNAARRASVATDSRFLRVLDAVQSTDPELGSYIVCEYATGQSLEVILSQGPLSGLEAGWVIREVADALSGVHSLGLHHRRISPETVIITPTGNVKIVGLLIEAALRPARHPLVHGAGTPELVDVLDLGRLLYATLVCRWPGGPGYGLPDAPTVGRRWMTPRQVRAGVSPALDNVCDQVLSEPPRHRAPQIATANDLVNALTKVLGSADASGDLERRLRQPIPRVGAAQPGQTTTATPVSPLLDQPTEPTPVVFDDDEPVRRRTAAADASPLRISQPVGAAAAVGAGDAGRAPAATTTVLRTPVPQHAPAPRPRPPRRPRRWIAGLVMLVVLLTGVGLVAGLVLSNQLSAAPDPGASATPARPPAASPASAVLPITSGRDFDPQGADDQRENPGEVPLAFDGDPATRWRTVAYIGNPRLGNLKRGVGLVLDLGSAQPVAAVQVTLSGTGTNLDLRVPRLDPETVTRAPLGSDRDWRVVAAQTGAGRSATLTAEQPVTTRFVLVYLTSLPREGGRYRGGISEVEVRR